MLVVGPASMSFQKLADTCWHNDVRKEHAGSCRYICAGIVLWGRRLFEDFAVLYSEDLMLVLVPLLISNRKCNQSTGPGINDHKCLRRHTFCPRRSFHAFHWTLSDICDAICILMGSCDGWPESVGPWKGWSLPRPSFPRPSFSATNFDLPRLKWKRSGNVRFLSNVLRALRRSSVQLWCDLVCCLFPSHQEICFYYSAWPWCFSRLAPLPARKKW